MNKNNKVLILAPHTDDGELGCGGSIARLIREGSEVYYAAFSLCTRSLPKGWASDTLEKEVRKATAVLGIPPSNLILHDFDVRRFKEFRQDILEILVQLKKDIQPDLVFVPSPTDIHQDHQVISEEGLRAFKSTSLYGYEMPWNNVAFNTRAFITLDRQDVSKKAEAMKEYQSQKHRPYVNEEFIFSLASVRGVQIGVQYAEAFEVIRAVM